MFNHMICRLLSVTRVYCDKTTEAKIMRYSLHSIAQCLYFLHDKLDDEILKGHPIWGWGQAEMDWLLLDFRALNLGKYDI